MSLFRCHHDKQGFLHKRFQRRPFPFVVRSIFGIQSEREGTVPEKKKLVLVCGALTQKVLLVLKFRLNFKRRGMSITLRLFLDVHLFQCFMLDPRGRLFIAYSLSQLYSHSFRWSYRPF